MGKRVKWGFTTLNPRQGLIHIARYNSIAILFNCSRLYRGAPQYPAYLNGDPELCPERQENNLSLSRIGVTINSNEW